MCGIAGILSTDPSLSGRLTEMLGRLVHRGPDEEGVWHGTLTDEDRRVWHVGLGTRRLVIHAPHMGRQPFAPPGGPAVVCNGEIYNHAELTRQLNLDVAQPRGEGASDTLALAQALARKGREALPLLDGMFALAYADAARGELTLAVDPFGQKPLYYSPLRGGGIAFASDLDALLALDEIDRSLNADAVGLYLLFDCVPAPATMLRNVYKVAPGTCVVWRPQGLSVRRYYDARSHMGARSPGRESDPLAEFGRRLAEGVGRHVNDVPRPGLLLSTGVDSGLLATELARQAPERSEAYTVAYSDPRWDESGGAAQVAGWLGLRHHAVPLDESSVPGLVTRLAERLDEPLNDPASLPSLHLFQYIAPRTRVVLTGDGGDEIFHGYPRHRLGSFCGVVDLLPDWVHGVASRVIRPPRDPSIRTRSFGRARRKLYNVLSGDGDELYRQLSHVWRPWLLGAVLPARFEASAAPRRSDPNGAAARSLPWPARAAYHDLVGQLPGVLLAKTDRCAMAFGVETRAPFLDRLVADYALALPDELKRRNGESKWMLREFLRRRLPGHLVARGKRGFGLPLETWIRTCLREVVFDHLSNPVSLRAVGIDPKAVGSLLAEHVGGVEDHGTKIWSLLVLSLWLAKLRGGGGAAAECPA